MLDLVKTLILDFQDEFLADLSRHTGIDRRTRIVSVEGKATICSGVRRSGKSTFLFQLMHQLLAGGIARQDILYLNFFDERLHNLSVTGLQVILDAYHALYPDRPRTRRFYCFFDEIQDVPDWAAFVERLLRTENCAVYITGSSAQLLAREIATQMRGRSLSWELFPFSFREFLDYQAIPHQSPLTTRQQMRIQHAFAAYWETGGFPEVLGHARWLRTRLHQEYFQGILYRDLVERHAVRQPQNLRDLALYLVDNVASLYTINRLTTHLHARGHRMAKTAVARYLDWMEDAYFLFTVRLFHVSWHKANVNPKKIYGVDHSLMSSLGAGILDRDGPLLENLVFTALRRVTTHIRYFKSRRGREVDFVFQLPDRTWQLVQVTATMAVHQTRQREVSALREAMSELSLAEGTIVTRHEQEEIDVPEGQIRVLPAWRFLLSLPETSTSAIMPEWEISSPQAR